MINVLVRNWGYIAMRGVLAILFGGLTLFYPGVTVMTLVFLFGAYAVVDGAFMIASAVANRKTQPQWGMLLFGGILGVTAGVATYVWPAMTAVVLLAIIATWAILMGIVEIAVAIRLRKMISGEWVMVLSGLVAIAFGMLLVMQPVLGGIAVALLIGAYGVVSGVLLLALGFRLRNWGRLHGVLATS